MTNRISNRDGESYLPGLEPPSIPAIDKRAEAHYDLARQIKALRAELNDLKEELIELMQEHDLEKYNTPNGIVVDITKKAAAKTTKGGVTRG